MMSTKADRALCMIRAYLAARATEPNGGDGGFEGLARTVVDSVLRTTSEFTHRGSESGDGLKGDFLWDAIRFIRENLDSKLKWDDIAGAIGVDPFSFGRGFKCATGMTPHLYIIRCRLTRAMQLLVRGDLALADIAFEVGCSGQSHLTTLFRKHLGTTPGAFRGFAIERVRAPSLTSEPGAVLAVKGSELGPHRQQKDRTIRVLHRARDAAGYFDDPRSMAART